MLESHVGCVLQYNKFMIIFGSVKGDIKIQKTDPSSVLYSDFSDVSDRLPDEGEGMDRS